MSVDPTLGYLLYLLDVWRRMWRQVPAYDNVSDDQIIRSLSEWYHQDYSNNDNSGLAVEPVNEILIRIMNKILISTTHGFGGWSIVINPRNPNQTAKSYLYYLIGLTNLTSSELSNRYRIRLDRSDSENSSQIQQKTETLLGILRDGFQCDDELRDNHIIPKEVQGLPPFFLEFDEWLSDQYTFYGENLYNIRDNVFAFITDANIN